MSDPRLRFRAWIDGELADETWIDSSKPNAEALAEQLADRHAHIVGEAQRQGRQWLVEMYDPAHPPSYTRMNTSRPVV